MLQRSKLALLVVLTFIFSVSLFAEAATTGAEENKINIPELGVKIDYTGWTFTNDPKLIKAGEDYAKEKLSSNIRLDTLAKTGIHFYLLEYPQNVIPPEGFNSNINMTTEILPKRKKAFTLDEYLEAVFQLYPKLLAGYKQVGVTQKLTIGGLPAALIEGTFTTASNDGDLQIHNYQLVFIKGNKAFVLTGTTTENLSNQKGPKILTVLKGIQSI
ncbi:hypothetical protein CH373_13430 [Leptospira perolatii]|uniref:Uncharacterized protein n=1 Tax=Leptospira perolatii TaxID=2023191 RepID=A0A2M9ZKZ2_9LEPT|nr:DcrB-related protein [Leptospira perolatii]PJZ69893.1 hypothetical protein CH360_08255 [Leptospira perolatii]PJZ72699.1 hypothetical protein CH373_13430 [Leptospira perolatii]